MGFRLIGWFMIATNTLRLIFCMTLFSQTLIVPFAKDSIPTEGLKNYDELRTYVMSNRVLFHEDLLENVELEDRQTILDCALQLACQDNDETYLISALNLGAEISVDNYEPVKILAGEGHLFLIDYVLFYYVIPAQVLASMSHRAILNNQLTTLKYLIDFGSPLGFRGRPLLVLAIENRQTSIVNFLLEHSKSPKNLLYPEAQIETYLNHLEDGIEQASPARKKIFKLLARYKKYLNTPSIPSEQLSDRLISLFSQLNAYNESTHPEFPQRFSSVLHEVLPELRERSESPYARQEISYSPKQLQQIAEVMVLVVQETLSERNTPAPQTL